MPIAHYAYTALDCPNPWRLADFYSQITDWRVQPFEEGETEETCEWLELHDLVVCPSCGLELSGVLALEAHKNSVHASN